MLNTLYTLRYADHHYRLDDGAGVEFGDDATPTEPPDYRDFAYLAFTVGMCYQVSDQTIRTEHLRRDGADPLDRVVRLRRRDHRLDDQRARRASSTPDAPRPARPAPLAPCSTGSRNHRSRSRRACRCTCAPPAPVRRSSCCTATRSPALCWHRVAPGARRVAHRRRARPARLRPLEHAARRRRPHRLLQAPDGRRRGRRDGGARPRALRRRRPRPRRPGRLPHCPRPPRPGRRGCARSTSSRPSSSSSCWPSNRRAAVGRLPLVLPRRARRRCPRR